ncbi:MAG: hypothetical protein QM758_08700 [Armatimonas sp.]
MLIDPDLKSQLDALPAASRRRAGRTENAADPLRGGIGPWRLAKRGDGRLRSRLERLFARLFVPYDIELHILLDASLAMTFTGFSPPVASEKFDYARKLTAALSYAGLLRYERVRVTGFAPARGSRAPNLRGKESHEALTRYLETLQPGGNTNFAAALRNALARGDDRSVFVIISDFSDPNWDRGLQALMHGTSRVVLIQVYDPASLEDVPDDNLGFLDTETGLAARAGRDLGAPALSSTRRGRTSCAPSRASPAERFRALSAGSGYAFWRATGTCLRYPERTELEFLMASPEKPLTDPADLFRLFGRFICAVLLTVFAVIYIVKADVAKLVFFSIASIVAQRATLKLWKELVAERQTALAERGIHE